MIDLDILFGAARCGLLGDAEMSPFWRSVTESTRVGTGWLLFGMAAQAIFLLCLLGQWIATRRGRRLVLPSAVIYFGLVATVMLLIYASVRRDLVFTVGQLVNMIIGFRLLEIVERFNRISLEHDDAPFPDVRPDSAERRRE